MNPGQFLSPSTFTFLTFPPLDNTRTLMVMSTNPLSFFLMNGLACETPPNERLFYPTNNLKPKLTKLTSIIDEKKHDILTFEQLERAILFFFFLKNDCFNLKMIEKVGDSFAFDRLISYLLLLLHRYSASLQFSSKCQVKVI